MTSLHDILDPDLLAWHIAEGNIKEQRHKTEPLLLYNYTQQCQYNATWDDTTRQCRGLIVDETGHVVARPYPKFFNVGEHTPDSYAGPLVLDPPLIVKDKADGSLAISYVRPSDGELAWATRGSFHSQQADWATEWWTRHFEGRIPPTGITWLAEAIYPQNRIVVDYGDRAELVLLDGIDNETGNPVDAAYWPARRVDTVTVVNHLDGLDPNSRPNTEGYVVTDRRGRRVKMKSDEYVRIHRLVTGINNRRVWEALRDGHLDDLIEHVPDEFFTWVMRTVDELRVNYHITERAATDTLETGMFAVKEAGADVATGEGRGIFARAIRGHLYENVAFAMLDRNDEKVASAIWQIIRPEVLTTWTDDDETR